MGITDCCLDIWKNGGVEIIANDRRIRSTSSCVTFTDIERLTGDVAKNPTTQNPENIVFDAQRLIVQSDIKLWSFKVLPDDGDKPMIQVQCMGE